MNEQELDTISKNLARAIRQKESGGDYNAVGDNGTSKGAWQWQGATWKAHAKEILGDANAEMTPEHQNVVAKGMMRKYVKEGKDAVQIAAIWNSGSDKGWENKIGTTTINGKPIAYDVPKYVKEVTENYRKFKAENPYQGEVSQETQAPANGVQPATPEGEKGIFASIVDPLSKFGGSVLKTLLPKRFEDLTLTDGPKLSEGQVSGITGNTIDVAGYRQGEELQGAEYTKDVIGTTAQAASYLPFGGAGATIGKSVLARTAVPLLKTAGLGAVSGALSSGGQALQEQKSLQEVASQAVTGGVIGGVAAPVIGVGANLLTKGVQKIFTTKSAQQIMSTPVQKLGTLSTTERNFYFSQKSDDIAKKYEAEALRVKQLQDTETQTLNKVYQETTAKAEKEFAERISVVKTEAEKLNTQLADASIQEAEALKPRLVQAMRKNSDTYRKLVDEEISSVADVQVTRQELASSIRNMFENDPNKAEQIISILDNKIEGPQTVKTIYEGTKALRQGISAGARSGSKTLSSQEYQTTEAISALLDFLKMEKGVDLSTANKFWSEWAPIKNKLYRYIQPYKPAGTETASFKTFAKLVASNDPYNQKFIQETEKILGVSFKDSKAREILSKIDANKKAQIVAKIESSTKVEQAKADKLAESISLRENVNRAKLLAKGVKQLEQDKLELTKLEATLKAERRTLLKRIIGGFLVVALGANTTNTIMSGV